MKRHAVRCEYMHIKVNGRQITIHRTGGVHSEPGDESIAARHSTSPCCTKGYVHTVQEVEHHDVICSVTFLEALTDKRPCEWMT
jgi:hypothetical protein